MLILGLDPGTATSGYGLVYKNGTSKLESVSYGLIETDKDADHGVRFEKIRKDLHYIINKFKPHAVAIEKLFFATNVKTAIRVGQACGVILLTISEAKLPVFEYAPGTIKKMISGNGRADKEEIQTAVRKYLGNHVRKIKGEKTHFDNSADALAVAICHIMTVRSQ